MPNKNINSRASGGTGHARHPNATGDGVRQLVADAYRRYENELTRFAAHSFGLSSADAQDLVHAAFEKFANYKDLHAVENPRAFLYRLVNNIATNNFRHSQVHNRYASQVQASPDNSEVNDDCNPESVAQNRQTLQHIAQIILAMPFRRRQIVVLHRFEHLSFAEIGRQLGITEAAVRKHIKKALQEIHQGLSSNHGTEADEHR